MAEATTSHSSRRCRKTPRHRSMYINIQKPPPRAAFLLWIWILSARATGRAGAQPRERKFLTCRRLLRIHEGGGQEVKRGRRLGFLNDCCGLDVNKLLAPCWP